MKCVVCKQANTVPGKATVTLERGRTTVVVKGVPAQVCPNCGEEYLDEKTTKAVLKTADAATVSGVKVEIREYAAA